MLYIFVAGNVVNNPGHQPLRGLRITLASAVLAGGASEAWAYRHFVTLDGISYLDLADAWFSGHFHDAVNAFWSPMYSWLLGAFLRLFHVTRPSEFAAVHVLNLILFGLTLVSFNHFLCSLVAYVYQNPGDKRVEPLSQWLITLLGYVVFAWAGIMLVGVRNTTPDLLVAAAILWASDILLQIRSKGASWAKYILLGLVLAFGYLSKAVLFPVAFVFLLASSLASRNRKRGAALAVVAGIVFILLSSAFILALSRKQGHATFGESGTLNYGWLVNNCGPYIHWHGQPPGMGFPLHPTRQILPDLPVFEFANPVYGTYPIWYDPTYWFAGMKTHFSASEQLQAVFRNVKALTNIVFALNGAWVFALVVLMCTGEVKYYVRELWSNAFLLLPSVTALVLYLLVLVLDRYVGPFVIVILVVCFGSVRLPANNPLSKRIGLAVVLGTLLLATFSAVHFVHFSRDVLASTEAVPNELWEVAAGAKRLGIQPGDKIAVLAPAIAKLDLGAKYLNPNWARLLGVRITTELASTDITLFWSLDYKTQLLILRALAATGAKAVVDYDLPPTVRPEGWTRIGDTRFFLRRLDNE